MNSLRDLEITDHGICACLQALSGNDDVFVYSHRREIVPQRDIRTILVSSTERRISSMTNSRRSQSEKRWASRGRETTARKHQNKKPTRRQSFSESEKPLKTLPPRFSWGSLALDRAVGIAGRVSPIAVCVKRPPPNPELAPYLVLHMATTATATERWARGAIEEAIAEAGGPLSHLKRVLSALLAALLDAFGRRKHRPAPRTRQIRALRNQHQPFTAHQRNLLSHDDPVLLADSSNGKLANRLESASRAFHHAVYTSVAGWGSRQKRMHDCLAARS